MGGLLIVKQDIHHHHLQFHNPQVGMNLHLNILRPDNISSDEFYRRCHDISPELFDLIQHRGGSISAEHGVGLLKRDVLSFSRSPAEIEIMRKLKSVFDPNNIMNPGKILR